MSLERNYYTRFKQSFTKQFQNVSQNFPTVITGLYFYRKNEKRRIVNHVLRKFEVPVGNRFYIKVEDILRGETVHDEFPRYENYDIPYRPSSDNVSGVLRLSY